MRSYARSTANRQQRLIDAADTALDADTEEGKVEALKAIRRSDDWWRAPVKVREYINAYVDLRDGQKVLGPRGVKLGTFQSEEGGKDGTD